MARRLWAASALGGAFDADTPVSSMPLTEVLARKPLGGSRLHAAAAMQFDLLLSTTKYVIPLVALITTGQVFNGIFSSMMTAQVLHKVPAMRPELHHLLLVCVGLLHTLLCAGKSPLHEMHAPDGGALLQLTWSWSAKDVLAIANIVALGATFSSAAGGGNEPFFCTSFAAGIALRMVLYELARAPSSHWPPARQGQNRADWGRRGGRARRPRRGHVQRWPCAFPARRQRRRLDGLGGAGDTLREDCSPRAAGTHRGAVGPALLQARAADAA